MVAILILNWNGYKDTIECIHSIYKNEKSPYFIIVGDNGSTDNSVDKIIGYAESQNIKVHREKLFHEALSNVDVGDLILYDMLTNNGFAKGNNLMIKYSRRFTPEYYFLLNNDTVVTRDFLSILLDFKCKNPQYHVIAPLIPYYYNKNRIWNAGGQLFWGFRRYHFENQDINCIKNREYLRCSFITGCAMLVSECCMSEDGSLFTEDFFFGEDDFELALRLKKKGILQACVLNSLVYHKVSASSNNFVNIDKIFIHYLNRYIDLRKNLSKFSFFVWKIVNNIYIYQLLRKQFDSSQVKAFIKELNKECSLQNGVTKDYFEKRLKIKK